MPHLSPQAKYLTFSRLVSLQQSRTAENSIMTPQSVPDAIQATSDKIQINFVWPTRNSQIAIMQLKIPTEISSVKLALKDTSRKELVTVSKNLLDANIAPTLPGAARTEMSA